VNDPLQLREAVVARLAQVIDPETGVDVMRMRLIENLAVDAQGRVA
jgi:metal-sulfur cluster biosynthetic enzyme